MFINNNNKKKNNRSSSSSNSNSNSNSNNREKEFFEKKCPDYLFIPTVLPKVERILVLGDIHGDYKLAIQMLLAGKVIDKNNNWIGGNTYVVQVGDQVDRCRPMGTYQCNQKLGTDDDEASDIKILKYFSKLHKQAIMKGGKVISLFGNHELLNIQGQLHYVSYKGLREFDNYIDPISNKVIRDGETARAHAFAPGNEYGKFLGCTRLATVIIGTNLFVHAGILPVIIDQLKERGKTVYDINHIIRKWLISQISRDTSNTVQMIADTTEHSIFWTRILGNVPINVSLKEDVCASFLAPVLSTLNIGSMIIGHTPQSFAKFGGINGTCYQYNNGKKGQNTLWRVDNGSSKAFDKFDEKYVLFNTKNEFRKPQVLEILNDNEYNVIVYDDK